MKVTASLHNYPLIWEIKGLSNKAFSDLILCSMFLKPLKTEGLISSFNKTQILAYSTTANEWAYYMFLAIVLPSSVVLWIQQPRNWSTVVKLFVVEIEMLYWSGSYKTLTQKVQETLMPGDVKCEQNHSHQHGMLRHTDISYIGKWSPLGLEL